MSSTLRSVAHRLARTCLALLVLAAPSVAHAVTTDPAPTDPTTVRLNEAASPSLACSYGSYTSVSPCTRTESVPPSSGSHTLSFTVVSYSSTTQYVAQCFYTAPVTGCSVTPAVFSTGQGAPYQATVTYTVGSATGTGSVTLSVFDLYGNGDEASATTMLVVAGFVFQPNQ